MNPTPQFQDPPNPLQDHLLTLPVPDALPRRILASLHPSRQESGSGTGGIYQLYVYVSSSVATAEWSSLVTTAVTTGVWYPGISSHLSKVKTTY